MSLLTHNPFNDSGIVSYEQFKQYPFLVFGVNEMLKNKLEGQAKQIKNQYFFGERLILLGERGIGKTSSLFFIHDLLKQHSIKSFIFSRLFEDSNFIMEHINMLIKQEQGDARFKLMRESSFYKFTQEPVYFLVDFPDTVETKNFKKFLEYLWVLLTHKNYKKINLIFAMNKSHYDKSSSYSEILGKFSTIGLERLNYNDTRKLIESRLKVLKRKVEEIFEHDVIKRIFDHSKGIPRNTISACCLLVDNSNGEMIKLKGAEIILKDRYFDKVIEDRVEDLELRDIYKLMIKILEDKFQGNVSSQEDYVKEVMKASKIGRNSVLARIADLIRFGIFNQYRGGYNRVNKIISLS